MITLNGLKRCLKNMKKISITQKFQERQRLVAKLKQLISEEEHVNEEMKQVVEAIEKLD